MCFVRRAHVFFSGSKLGSAAVAFMVDFGILLEIDCPGMESIYSVMGEGKNICSENTKSGDNDQGPGAMCIFHSFFVTCV